MRRLLIRLVIVLAAVAAGALLWSWSDTSDQDRGLVGGRLFDVAPERLRSVEIRRTAGVDTLVRRPDGVWHLVGPTPDLVDQDRLAMTLEEILAGVGLPVIAGTEPDERRFGFGGANAVELVFNLEGGGRRRLALGDAAPVTDQIYASGAGRPGVFGVSAGYYVSAARLPTSVRLPQLLPPLALADLDSFELTRRGGRPLVFTAGDFGVWWVRLPQGLDGLTGLAANYQAEFDDRRRRHAESVYLRADTRRLRELVFRASNTDVKAFGDATTDMRQAADLGLEPPYRGLTMHTRGGETWRVDFGEEQEDKSLAARRQGAFVITRNLALHPCEGPPSAFLDLGALGFELAWSDSFRVDQPDRPLIWGRRVGRPHAPVGRDGQAWAGIIPPGWRTGFPPDVVTDHVNDLQIYLDRLAMQAVLPSRVEQPLAPRARWRLQAWLADGRQREVWIGLRADSGDAALWEPTTGKFLQIDDEIVTSLRSLRLDLVQGS